MERDERGIIKIESCRETTSMRPFSLFAFLVLLVSNYLHLCLPRETAAHTLQHPTLNPLQVRKGIDPLPEWGEADLRQSHPSREVNFPGPLKVTSGTIVLGFLFLFLLWKLLLEKL
jgi:hypothetical protein